MSDQPSAAKNEQQGNHNLGLGFSFFEETGFVLAFNIMLLILLFTGHLAGLTDPLL
jgi:hypothetical protein